MSLDQLRDGDSNKPLLNHRSSFGDLPALISSGYRNGVLRSRTALFPSRWVADKANAAPAGKLTLSNAGTFDKHGRVHLKCTPEPERKFGRVIVK
jgi:hypothetical protein